MAHFKESRRLAGRALQLAQVVYFIQRLFVRLQFGWPSALVLWL